MKKEIKNLLIASSVFAILEVISLIVLICALTLRIFPERFTISDMNQIMIQQGQPTTLILLYTFGVLLGVCIIANFIVGPWFIVKYINYNSRFIFNKMSSSKVLKILYFILFPILSLLFICLPIIFLPFIWLQLFGKLSYYSRLRFLNFNNSKFISCSKKYSLLLVIFIPILIVSISVPMVINAMFVPKKPFINKTDINNFLTLSNNHPNSIMLYFDRAQGLMWNNLLYIDYLINKDNSFISENPEFTSFLMTLSQANITNGSNPSIVSGVWYSPWFKNTNFNDPYNPKNNFKDLKMDQFWSSAFSNQTKMFVENDTKNIHISSVPYFSYLEGKTYGEPTLLNESISKVGGIPACTTNEAIVSYKNNFNKYNRAANAVALAYAPENLSFKNTNSGVYQGWYFHHTHQNYSYYSLKKKEFVVTNSSELNFVKSMWFSIQALKGLMNKLKQEPYYNDEGKVDGNVYQHTQIIITSDHGYSFVHNEKLVQQIFKYLGYSDEFINNFNDNYKFAYNTVFMYKPFLNTYKNQEKFKFDDSHLVLNSDIQLFFESGLKRYNYLQSNSSMVGFEQNESYFKPEIKNSSLPTQLIQLMNNNIIIDPFANLDELNNRTILETMMASWRYSSNAKNYDLWAIYKVKIPQPYNLNTLYNNNETFKTIYKK